MSTVKISQLPLITSLNANTANSLFMGVDIPTGTTGKFTAHTLAANLYSNEILNVGVNQQNLPNTIAQFSLSGDSYIQTNLVNTNDGGTADQVVTANVGSGGSDSTNFIDMGWANKNYQPGSEFNNIGNAVNPNDGYLYTQGTAGQAYGNLIIGTTTSGANLKFIVGGGTAANIVARMTSTGLVLNTQSSITFSDSTVQSSAASPATYSQAAFAAANTAANNVAIIQGVNTTQNTNITTANNAAFAAFASVNTALQNTSTITVNSNLVIPGNITISGLLSTANVTINRDIILNDGGVYQYSTSNNSTVTQLTSKSTAVTCNGRTGQITTSSASLAKGVGVSFTVNNSQIVSAKDVVIVNLASGGTLNSYQVAVDAVAPGSFSICIVNNGSGALAETLVINFAIIRVN